MKHLLLTILISLVSLLGKSVTDKYRVMFNGSDASTEATIGWNQVAGSNPIVYFDTVDHGTNWNAYQFNQAPDRIVNFKGMDNHFVRLTGLQADQAYYFVIKDSDGTSTRFWFKTITDNPCERLSIIAGGDSRSGQTQRQNSNLMVSKLRPDAIWFGGDLTNSATSSQTQVWLDDWQMSFGLDGRIFPIIVAYGNHEANALDGLDYLYNIFDVPHDNYWSTNFGGDLMTLYTINSEVFPWHMVMNSGIRTDQRNWFQNHISNNPAKWKSAQYHRPIVPHYTGKDDGHDEYDDFAQHMYDYGCRLVIESDAHVVKFTEPVAPTGTSVGFTVAPNDPNAIVFTGEGTWGTLRTIDDIHAMTKAGGSFYQFAWIFIDECSIELRKIDTQSPNTVGYVNDNDKFSLPSGLDALIWKPTSIPTGVYTISRCTRPIAAFEADTSNVFTGQNVQFTDTTVNPSGTFVWNFGDGNSSTNINPTHAYSTPGQYIVSLTYDDGVHCSTSAFDTIYVSTPTLPDADFIATPTTVIAGSNTQFTDLSTGVATSWNWTFSGGTPSTSTQQNPVIQYNTPGFYEVSLIVTNAFGSDVETKTNYIYVPTSSTITIPVANGNDDAEENTSGFNVGNMYITSSDLEIGNDNLTDQHVGVRFQNVTVPSGAIIDSAYIRFMADDSDNSGMLIYIAQEAIDNSPTFSSNDYDITSRTLTSNQYAWTNPPAWNNGNYHNTPNLNLMVQEVVDRPGWSSGNAMSFVLFSTPGETSERVASSYEGGTPAELIIEYTLPVSAPVASFNSNAGSNVCTGDTIQFTDLTSNNPNSWNWEITGPSTLTSNQQNPSFIFNTPGVYDVSLIVSNSGGGDTITTTSYITVYASPTVTFTAFNPDTLCVDAGPVAVINGSPSGGTYSGSGVTGNNFEPSNAGVGAHQITYVFTDTNNCSGMESGTVYVVLCNSITINSDDDILVYPNPTDGDLIIELNNTSAARLVILNSKGQLVHNSDCRNEDRIKMDVASWAKGSYFIQLQASDGAVVHSQQLIVQ